MAKKRRYAEETILEQPTKVSDLGTPELHRRLGGIDVTLNPHTGQLRGRVRTQRPIDYYLNKGYIEDYHYQAAQAFDWDYRRKEGISSAIRSSLHFERGGSLAPHIEDKMANARERYVLCRGVLDRAEKSLIEAIVFDDGYLKDLKGQWKTYGMLTPLTVDLLCRALDKVAEFYGLINRC